MIDGPDGIGIALMPQTYEMVVDGLTSPIRIPIYPVRTVEGIAWEDENGSHSTTTEFRLIKSTGTVHHDLSASALPDSVIVTFTAGYDVVPADLRHAVLMLVGHLYENREATASTKLERVPFAVESILSRYRVA